MNDMQKQRSTVQAKSGQKKIRELSHSVGDFIRYWGFRRIHGALWTQLYLSKKPLTGAELVMRLKVSKALVSPALAEMEEWQLIVPVQSDNAKAKYFRAEQDVFKIIRLVLATREQVMIDQVEKNCLEVKKDLDQAEIDPERLEDIQQMIQSAQLALQLLMHADSFETVAQIFEGTGRAMA
jgi:DNA-binding transcriptional regulator GbsR (MarR family)